MNSYDAYLSQNRRRLDNYHVILKTYALIKDYYMIALDKMVALKASDAEAHAIALEAEEASLDAAEAVSGM